MCPGTLFWSFWAILGPPVKKNPVFFSALRAVYWTPQHLPLYTSLVDACDVMWCGVAVNLQTVDGNVGGTR